MKQPPPQSGDASDKVVAIDCFVRDFPGFRPGFAVVVVDVIRATTMLVTAVAAGRQCFPLASLRAAVMRADKLRNPLLAGELSGNTPHAFDLDNSLAAVLDESDTSRPLVLLSTTGTELVCRSARIAPYVYAACLRNYSAQAAHLVAHHSRVAIIGAGSRGEFREEDQLCCAWIAARLLDAGYAPEGPTLELVQRWRDAPLEAILASNSVRYLLSTGRERDLEFIMSHIDDVDAVFRLVDGQIVIDGRSAT